MFKKILKNYFVYALIAAIVYCVTVVIFLGNDNFQSIWVLYLGNALYLAAIAIIVYTHNKRYKDSSVTSAISGHVLSITGATIAVVLSLILYFLFSTGIFNGQHGEVLKQAPVQMRRNSGQGMLFVLIVNAALGNTITGFFAAVFASFTAGPADNDVTAKEAKR